MARIEAICRRTATRPTAVMQVGELTLDLSTRRVSRPDGEVKLTPTEFSVLELLARHVGQVVTRRMLCEHLWGFNWDGNTNVIDVHINRVRNKLDRKLHVSPIETVRGRGYAIRVS
jgi:DNA-binding response OmpR family regulator